jgi:hypothetical protein
VMIERLESAAQRRACIALGRAGTHPSWARAAWREAAPPRADRLGPDDRLRPAHEAPPDAHAGVENISIAPVRETGRGPDDRATDRYLATIEAGPMAHGGAEGGELSRLEARLEQVEQRLGRLVQPC